MKNILIATALLVGFAVGICVGIIIDPPIPEIVTDSPTDEIRVAELKSQYHQLYAYVGKWVFNGFFVIMATIFGYTLLHKRQQDRRDESLRIEIFRVFYERYGYTQS